MDAHTASARIRPGDRQGWRNRGGHDVWCEKDSAIEHYEKALKLFPESPITRIEYGNGSSCCSARADREATGSTNKRLR
jgi:hypothetical protein